MAQKKLAGRPGLDPAPAVANPYKWDRVDLGLFVGRDTLLDEMRRGTQRAARSYVVLGGRRIGKTSLLRKLAADLEGSLAFPVYVDVQSAARSSGLPAFWADVLEAVGQAIGPTHPSEAQLVRASAQLLHDDLGGRLNPFSQVEKALAPLLAKVGLCLMLDEVEGLVVEEWADDFWAHCRALVHNTPGISERLGIVLSGGNDLEELANDRTSSLFGVLETRRLGGLEASEVDSLCGRGPMRLKPAVRKKLHAWSGGHPFIAQYMLSGICERHPQDASKAMLETREHFIKGQEMILRQWWSSLGQVGQRLYLHLSRAEGPTPKASLMTLGTAREVNRSLDTLQFTGLATEIERGHYQWTGQVFRVWVEEHSLEAFDVGPAIANRRVAELASSGGWPTIRPIDEKIRAVELELRRVISRVYEAEHGQHAEERMIRWLSELNNGKELEEIEERRRRAPSRFAAPAWKPPTQLIHYTTLGQLQKLVIGEWDKFNLIFGSGKDARRKFVENFCVVNGMRNALSHPLPENCSIPPVELRRAEVAADDLILSLQRFLPADR